ncbi:MAG TPA: cytochrome c [Terriglobales bacterium]|nr:cytochrome c [Terriglobales bacterium]
MSRRSKVVIFAVTALVSLAALAGYLWLGQTQFVGDEAQGQALFVLHCADCHENENSDLHKQPPKLEGLFRSKTLPSGAPATDAQVRKTIIEGRKTMPAFDQRLSEKDVDELVRYLHTLR